MSYTCIHVSSRWCSGDDSGDVKAGGMGWINLGTTTKSLPRTKIAPALLAVPSTHQKLVLLLDCKYFFNP
jgi:hypothetical protein